MTNPIKVLVVGATGQQGGAVARALAARGHRVRGMTRNPDSGKAQRLSAAGIEVVRADLRDASSLDAALAGMDAAFAMSTPFESGMDAEVKQGVIVADAVARAGTAHLVYTSVAGANRESGIPHFESKWKVEQYLRENDIPHTVIAPVYFMDNVFFPQNRAALAEGRYATPLPPTRALQQIAVDDIGAFGALVIERRDELLGKRIDIASDELSGEEQARLMSEQLGRTIEYQQLPMDVIRGFSEDLALMYQWFIDVGYDTDIEALRRDFPDVGWHRMSDWLSAQDWGELSA